MAVSAVGRTFQLWGGPFKAASRISYRNMEQVAKPSDGAMWSPADLIVTFCLPSILPRISEPS